MPAHLSSRVETFTRGNNSFVLELDFLPQMLQSRPLGPRRELQLQLQTLQLFFDTLDTRVVLRDSPAVVTTGSMRLLHRGWKV